MALQGAHERLSGMGHLAGGAHLLFDWIQKPDRGAGELGVDVFDVYARGAADHRGPTPARVAGPGGNGTGEKQILATSRQLLAQCSPFRLFADPGKPFSRSSRSLAKTRKSWKLTAGSWHFCPIK